MPSCVIKCCKNYSGRKNKRPDITFHLFPKNEAQLNDWINIVQDSRNQNDWKPSKASVVCSTHFDPDDLFTTKNGLVRVVANAVPRLYLKEPPRTQQQFPAEPHLNRPLQVLIKLDQPWTLEQPAVEPNLNGPLPVKLIKLEQPWTNEHPTDAPNLISPLQQLIKLEHPWTEQQPSEESNLSRPLQKFQPFQLIKLEQPWTQQQPAEEPNLRALQEFIKVEQPWTQQQPAEETNLKQPMQVLIELEQPRTQLQPAKDPSLNRRLQQMIELEQPNTHNDDVEQPLPTFPRREYLQKIIKQKDEVIKKKNKAIKALNQKIRRLQERNKSLKDILKTLKNNFFIDTDLFGKLNEDIVAINLFNNYNRKKLKKNIDYTSVFIKFCQTLNNYSPKAYDYVRDTFDTCLPHRKTLAKWCRDVNGEPGFTGESFQSGHDDDTIE